MMRTKGKPTIQNIYVAWFILYASGFSHHTNDNSQKSSAPPFIPPECYVFSRNT